MQGTSPDILIIGGGVAGMSAARALAGQDLGIHLVESRKELGGHAASWACMATDQCQNCGACLAREMADQLRRQSNVTLHLNTRVRQLEKDVAQIRATLDSGQELTVGHLINATGFTPFDPAALPALGVNRSPRIITTAQLNQALIDGSLTALVDGKADPRIAFIQCVGSRNRRLGRDYCSQVCCRISLRHSEKLLHQMPGADITLFYMDLQIIGKETRSLVSRLAPRVNLIQGVPGEILESDGALTLVTQNPDPGTGQPRQQHRFDLVVLSVGMGPAQAADELATALDQPRNQWGFFTHHHAKPPEFQDNVQTIGCAVGPRDIVTSIQDGRMAAAQILAPDVLEQPRTLAVLGNGVAAQKLTRAAEKRGHQIIAFHQDPGHGDGPSLADITAIQGSLGNFTLHYQGTHGQEKVSCQALIAAPEPLDPPPRALALPKEGPEAPIIKPLDLHTLARNGAQAAPDRTLILMDYDAPAPAQAGSLALNHAMALVKSGKACAIALHHAAVSGMTGHQDYDEARRSGVLFFRYTGHGDIELSPTASGIALTVTDTSLGDLPLESEWDCLVMPPDREPHPVFESLSRLLDRQWDAEGYLQAANIRHRRVHSPRRGVFFAGFGHDDLTPEALDREIHAVLAELALLPDAASPPDTGDPPDTGPPKVDPEACAQCLTCYRICPHAAISLCAQDNRPIINPQACFNCRLCQVNCPACAIDGPEPPRPEASASTVILACRRSAALAAQNLKLPAGVSLIPLPCACRVSPALVLDQILGGAERVILTGCHSGNCQSLEGSREAQTIAGQVANLPGMAPDSVSWEPVAANEPARFRELIQSIGKGGAAS